MLKVMSDSCMNEFVDVAWDEFFQSGDHIVPYTGSRRLADHFILGDSHKKPRRELTNISSYTGDRSAARYVDQGREQGGFSNLRKRMNTMLEKDSRSDTPNGVFTSGTENGPIKETSISASGNTMPSAHVMKDNIAESNGSEFCGYDTTLVDKTTIVDSNCSSYPLGDVNHTSNDFDIFENAENKDSSDFLYYGWPEIENFEDVDRMFRNCDSTFGLEVSKEDDLGWLSSAEDLGGSGDVLNPDFKFPCPGTNLVNNMLENHDSLKGYSINDCPMTNALIGSNDSSGTSEKSDSYLSFVTGPAIADAKDEFIPHGQGLGLNDKIQPRISTSHTKTDRGGMNNNRKKQIKLPNRSEQKSREHDFGIDSFSNISDPPNEVTQLASGLTSHQACPSVHMQQLQLQQQQQQQHSLCPDSFNYLQNPISYVPSDNSHLSDPASVNENLKPSTVKYETKDLTSLSPRDSSHASSQLLHTENSHDPPFEVTAPLVREQREKLHSCQGSRSSLNGRLRNGSLTVQASAFDPGSVLKYENHSDPEGVSLATPAELGSSNVQESSTMSSGLDDISQEAASFRQLQHVMERLDLRTKLCIRDSLYRLARSAEQRHNHAYRNIGCGDERDAGGGASIAEETNKCTGYMDIETDTNPIDRSIAHLLFHRPTGTSTAPVHEPFPLKSLNAVHGSVASPPSGEEAASGEHI